MENRLNSEGSVKVVVAFRGVLRVVASAFAAFVALELVGAFLSAIYLSASSGKIVRVVPAMALTVAHFFRLQALVGAVLLTGACLVLRKLGWNKPTLYLVVVTIAGVAFSIEIFSKSASLTEAISASGYSSKDYSLPETKFSVAPFVLASMIAACAATWVCLRILERDWEMWKSPRVRRAFSRAFFVTLVVGQTLGAIYIAVYKIVFYQRSPGLEVFLIVGGIVVTFLPTLIFAAIITEVSVRTIERKWSPDIPFLVAIPLAYLMFEIFISLTPATIVQYTDFRFRPPPYVKRPFLIPEEVPHVFICIFAGRKGVRACLQKLTEEKGVYIPSEERRKPEKVSVNSGE